MKVIPSLLYFLNQEGISFTNKNTPLNNIHQEVPNAISTWSLQLTSSLNNSVPTVPRLEAYIVSK